MVIYASPPNDHSHENKDTLDNINNYLTIGTTRYSTDTPGNCSLSVGGYSSGSGNWPGNSVGNNAICIGEGDNSCCTNVLF